VGNKENNRALYYGTRKADKFVRCYQKDELGVFRVETELHSGLLRRNEILALDDFIHLPGLICPKHLQFVDVNWEHLEQSLVNTLGVEGHRVLAGAERRAASLQRLRRYLTRNGVVNIHRFLVPLTLNQEVGRALHKWARHFKKDRYE
jgi:hypothetical protein